VLWMALGFALKPLIIVLILLAAVLYPRTSWRMVLAMLALWVLPLLAQRPDYVLEQYRQSVQMLHDATAFGPSTQFPHLFWVLHTAGVEIPAAGQNSLRLLAAALTLAFCWVAQRKCSAAQAGVLLYTMAVIYLLLFNPRTEHNGYCLLAVSLAIYIAQAVAARSWLVAAALIGIAIAMLASYPLGQFVPTVWLKPLVCILFLAIALGQFWRETIAIPGHNSIRRPSA
jgi:alpha-1,2-mannosyltransferase